jgi:hypothetical protein
MAELARRLETWLATEAAWRDVDLASSKEARLRAFESGTQLVAACRAASRPGHEQLVAALVRQARRSPAPVWSAALVVVSAAWLDRLVERFTSHVRSPEDLVSEAVAALFAVTFRRRARDGASAAWLRAETLRQLIAWLREAGELEGGASDERRRARRRAPGRARVRARRVVRLGGVVASRRREAA